MESWAEVEKRLLGICKEHRRLEAAGHKQDDVKCVYRARRCWKAGFRALVALMHLRSVLGEV
jgi:hypothetical protein